ncbi:MAG: hypothetical protein EOP48_23865 [Sphingobacteriales bacterium]|nr:MAG: hypothetical protein EOP48_23865 [Sphingobacteriales bacterium]
MNGGSNSKDMDMTVLAFVSLDGYLVIYDFITMEPRLSYKSNFGGLNSLSFSEDCELVALLEDDNGMELLVQNKIISLDLPVKEVYKKVWLTEGGERDTMRIVYRVGPASSREARL